LSTAAAEDAVPVEENRAPLTVFWQAARELDSEVRDESDLAGAREGHLADLLKAAGLHLVEETTFAASVEYASFDEWWEPFTLGVGRAGAHAKTLDPTPGAAACRSSAKGRQSP